MSLRHKRMPKYIQPGARVSASEYFHRDATGTVTGTCGKRGELVRVTLDDGELIRFHWSWLRRLPSAGPSTSQE